MPKLQNTARAVADHLAAHGMTYLTFFIAARLFGPLLDDAIPNPFKIVMCILKDWLPWAIELGVVWLAIKLAMRAFNSRSGDDVAMLAVTVLAAAVVGGLALNPDKLVALLTRIGVTGITFSSCT